MINYTSQKQLSLFQTPFDQQLDPHNRWVKLSHSLPWDQLVKIYIKKLRSDFGAPGINARMVIGALIIKHRLTLSDMQYNLLRVITRFRHPHFLTVQLMTK